MGIQPPGRPNLPTPYEKKKKMSRIRWTKMEEKVGWSHGHYTVVNILKPSLRVERTKHHLNRDPSKKNREAFYRVILSFNLQVAIAGFDRGGRYQAYNRFFDNISLRYLFQDGEKHYFDPKADPVQSSLKVTNTETHSQSLDAGVSGVTPATFAPKVEAHLNSEGTVVVEQESQKSWRSGLSFEPYQPPDRHHSHSHSHSYPKHEHHRHHYHSYSSGDIISYSPGPFVATTKRPHHPKHFTVKSPHADSCTCPQVISPHTCHLQDTGLVTYSKAAHWSWQARADIELWGPENYESMTRRITVARYICVDDVDPWIDQLIPNYTKEKEQERIRPFLHFDFILESRLRELDHGWNGIKNAFRRLPKPPETRRKADSGLPLRRDKVAFCVSPCYEMVAWPFYKTRNFAKEATLIMNGDIKSSDKRILPDDEYFKQKDEKKEAEKKKKEEAEKGKKEEKNSGTNGRSNNSGARCSCCTCERHPERSPSHSSNSSFDEYYGEPYHHHHNHHIHRGSRSRSRSRSPSPRLGMLPQEYGSLPPSRRESRIQEELEHARRRNKQLEEELRLAHTQAEAQEQTQPHQYDEEKSSASEDSDVEIGNFDRRKERQLLAAQQYQQHQQQQERPPAVSAPPVVSVIRIERPQHRHRHGHAHGHAHGYYHHRHHHNHHHHHHPRSRWSSISSSRSRTPSPRPDPRPDRGPRDGSPSADGGESIQIRFRSSSRVRDQSPRRSPSPRGRGNRSPSPRPNPRPGGVRGRAHARYDDPSPYPNREQRAHVRVRSRSRERTRSRSRGIDRVRIRTPSPVRGQTADTRREFRDSRDEEVEEFIAVREIPGRGPVREPRSEPRRRSVRTNCSGAVEFEGQEYG